MITNEPDEPSESQGNSEASFRGDVLRIEVVDEEGKDAPSFGVLLMTDPGPKEVLAVAPYSIKKNNDFRSGYRFHCEHTEFLHCL